MNSEELPVKDAPASQIGLWRRLARMPVALTVVGILIAFFCINYDLELEKSLELWALDPEKTRGPEPWRLFTHQFLSYGWFMFLLSVFIDFMMVRQLEEAIESRRTALLIGLCLLTCGAANLTFPGQMPAFGSSAIFYGGIGGILGYVLADRGSLVAFFKDPMVHRYAFFLGLIASLDFLAEQDPRGHGHWFSLLSGFLLGRFLTPLNWPGTPQARNGWIGSAVITLLILGGTAAAFRPRLAKAVLRQSEQFVVREREALLDRAPATGDERAKLKQHALEQEGDASAFQRGLLNLRAGAFELALEDLRRAVKLEPDIALRQAILGLAYVRNRNPLDAKEALRRALELDPELYEAHYWLGFAQRGAARQQALNDFLKACPQSDEFKAMRAKASEALR